MKVCDRCGREANWNIRVVMATSTPHDRTMWEQTLEHPGDLCTGCLECLEHYVQSYMTDKLCSRSQP